MPLEFWNFVNADTITEGLAAFCPEDAALKAGRIMLARLNELAAQGRNFAFEAALASRFYARWLANRKSFGYRVHIIF